MKFKPKDMVPIPWLVALALQADGWFLRQDIIWAKPNPMPESVTDRCTKSHEFIFLLSKSARYFFDAEAIKEPANGWNGSSFTDERDAAVKPNLGKGPRHETASRNKRSVWTVPSAPYPHAHFATYPPDLIKPCILAGTSARGCCKCGAPWERVVETKLVKQYACRHGGFNAKGTSGGMVDMSKTWSPGHNETTTTGWQPTCTCGVYSGLDGNTTAPCTVLDPFGGSGTTGMVALELGRNAILIELNPEYVKLAQLRTAVTPGLAL